MARRRSRLIAALIIAYFIHGMIVQHSDTSRYSVLKFQEESSHAAILQALENAPQNSPDWKSIQRASRQDTFNTNYDNYDRVLPKANNENRSFVLESLRYAAFGTSRTWGSGLEDPNSQAYVKVLSPKGVNFGLRATAADFPSICLYSMVGDKQVFDVIILEFTPAGGKYHKDLDRLARRARARFPSAIIIYLPFFWILHEVHYQNKQLFNHLAERNIKSQYDPAFQEFVKSLPDSELLFVNRTTFHHLEAYRKTMNSIGGYMLEFPIYDGKDIKKFIMESVKLIGNPSFPLDDNHPSIMGHRRIAENIQQLLLKIPLPSTSGVGDWLGGKDSCVSWFSNGNVGSDGDVDVSNMKMNQFAHESDKWAWEVSSKGGTITVNCRTPPCDVYLGHMASTHIENYPRAWLEMNNETITVSPLIFAEFPQNVNLITQVGTMKSAGKSLIRIRPYPDRAANPFRITGILVSPSFT